MTEQSNDRRNDGSATGVIERLFYIRDAIGRHLAAPMLSAREAYLGKLLASGHKRQFVADRAATLCHIVNRQWFAESSLIGRRGRHTLSQDPPKTGVSQRVRHVSQALSACRQLQLCDAQGSCRSEYFRY